MLIGGKKFLVFVVLVAVIATAFLFFKVSKTKPVAQNLLLPAGFRIETFIDKLNGPRVIEFDAKGRMLVSETGAGDVLIIQNQKKSTLLNGLKSPHGLAFYTDP